jgi:hypothetical protein
MQMLFVNLTQTRSSMKNTILALIIFLVTGVLQAQTVGSKPDEDVAPAMDTSEMMQLWVSYMSPGPMHRMLAEMDGEWEEVITMYMDPSAPPATTNVTITKKMILGGRYQESKHKGDMMGIPFEGIGTIGYDNAAKKFVSSWVDNMGSGLMYSEGVWNEDTKTLVFLGKLTDPVTGLEVEIRETLRIIDADHHEVKMFTIKNGQEILNMEGKISRKRQ